MELTLIIITSLVLLSQFFIDFIIENKKLKIQIGIGVVIFGLISIWLAFIVQEKEKVNAEEEHAKEIKDQKDSFNKLDSSYVVLETELRIRNEDLVKIKTQNDSLNNILRQMREKQDQALKITKYSATEVNKSRVAIENMGFKQISRGLSEADKIAMTRLLRKYKGSNVTLTTVMGDSESMQFANQIKQVLTDAGWAVNGINQAMYSNVIQGIYIIVKSQNYPKRVDAIFESFKVLEMVAKGELNDKLNDDEVEIIIGIK